jgi:hypothetical protein
MPRTVAWVISKERRGTFNSFKPERAPHLPTLGDERALNGQGAAVCTPRERCRWALTEERVQRRGRERPMRTSTAIDVEREMDVRTHKELSKQTHQGNETERTSKCCHHFRRRSRVGGKRFVATAREGAGLAHGIMGISKAGTLR